MPHTTANEGQGGRPHQLFWPEGPEFVRTAARFGATIVPLSAVGVDDGLEVVLDGPELLRLPLLGVQPNKMF